MISRLTASAAVFAVLSAATITFAANSGTSHEARRFAAAESARAPVLVQLPRVEVIGRRAAPGAR